MEKTEVGKTFAAADGPAEYTALTAPATPSDIRRSSRRTADGTERIDAVKDFVSPWIPIWIRRLPEEDAAAAYKNTGEREDGGYKSQETPSDLGKHSESSKM
jgi:hypothetical protein